MRPTSLAFAANAKRALADEGLQTALERLDHGFPARRREAIARLPEFEALRDEAVAIKDRSLARLDSLLETFEAKVIEAGGKVHWARTAAEAGEEVLAICRAAKARRVIKGKSMLTEEIALNDRLAAAGLLPVETDLGEYIIQLRAEPPSHLLAPAIHLTQADVAQTFKGAHSSLAAERDLGNPRALLDEARGVLRRRFLEADVGITGANALIAETGTVVLVTNEGNGDLSMTLPRVHIVVAGIEKVVADLTEATTILRVLARSATGQELSVYTTFATGPRRPEDTAGPEEFHVVLVDNGRSALLGGPYSEVLRCIRCAACLNHCPIYSAVGGHAYGWVYSGPVGAVLTPALEGIHGAHPLPEASTLCGRCEEVCPVRIPLPRMLRRLRDESAVRHLSPVRGRWALMAWAFLARRPWLYRLATRRVARYLAWRARGRGRVTRLLGAGGWMESRDLAAPEGRTFAELWRRRRKAAKPEEKR